MAGRRRAVLRVKRNLSQALALARQLRLPPRHLVFARCALVALLLLVLLVLGDGLCTRSRAECVGRMRHPAGRSLLRLLRFLQE